MVRMAAIAVKDDRRIAFQIALDRAVESFPHYLQIIARGYGLTGMTTFTNGTIPLVLTVYTENAEGASFWHFGSTGFPGDRPGEWLAKGVRPFTISCRPEGDFWEANLSTKRSNGVDWKLHSELSLIEFEKILAQAKADGFRPDNLFVCPGTVRGGFGVVLTHDDPGLLWEVHANRTSAQLVTDLARMAEKGYAPDQVVGYAIAGASRYVVCWTRNPTSYPATGLAEAALEPLDVACEEFFVEHRIPKATLAVHRAGRLALARGFGHADDTARTPIAPTAAMALADLSRLLPLPRSIRSFARKSCMKKRGSRICSAFPSVPRNKSNRRRARKHNRP